MQNKIKEIIVWLSLIIMFLIMLVIICIRFYNPSLTETELFLKTWWFFIPLSICVFGYYWGSQY